MFKALMSGGALVGIEFEHGKDEGAEIFRFVFLPFVFFNEHVFERPHLQLADVAQLACNN